MNLSEKLLLLASITKGNAPQLAYVSFHRNWARAVCAGKTPYNVQVRIDAPAVPRCALPAYAIKAIAPALSGADRLPYDNGMMAGIKTEKAPDAYGPAIIPIVTLSNPVTIAVDGEIIASLARAAVESGVRYYLETVCIQPRTGYVVSSDGHRLHAWHFAAMPDCLVSECLIPLPAVRTALRLGLRSITLFHFTPAATAELPGPMPRISYALDCDEGIVSGRPVDAKYPDWQKIAEFPKAAPFLPVSAGAIALCLADVESSRADREATVVSFAAGKRVAEVRWPNGVTRKVAVDHGIKGKTENGFNVRYLREAVEFVGEDGGLQWPDHSNALKVSAPDRLALVMPRHL
jgi:hypothetical protein